jgi:hypothetical protein
VAFDGMGGYPYSAMAGEPLKPRLISIEGAIGLLAAALAAAADMSWYVRSFIVLFALGLIAYLAWRSPRHAATRIALASLASVLFVTFTWHPIWEDFEKKHPEKAIILVNWLGTISQSYSIQELVIQSRELADFAAESSIRIALAVLAVVLLGWGWRPFWNLRRHLRFVVRSALGEQTWIGRE